MKLNKLVILILTAAVLTLIIAGAVGENQHEKEMVSITAEYTQKTDERQKTMDEFIAGYNDLYASYNELYGRYEELAAENGFYQGWELYEVTAYMSLDDGCNDIAATGINIRQLSKYYNFCAVDPELIPYGSVVLVKFDTGIEAFLATDCGADIKGNRLDLYFVVDRGNAFEFGSRDLEIKVIRG